MNRDKLESEISGFKKDINLPSIKPPDDIEFILNADRATLQSKDNEELAIDSVRLCQYSVFLKLQSNRYKATINWCLANIDSIIGRELSNTKGYGYKEKSVQIIRHDKDARQLNDMKVYAESKIQIIEDLDRKLEFMATSIRNLIFARKSD